MKNLRPAGYAGKLGYASAGAAADFIVANMVAEAISGSKTPKEAMERRREGGETQVIADTCGCAGYPLPLQAPRLRARCSTCGRTDGSYGGLPDRIRRPADNGQAEPSLYIPVWVPHIHREGQKQTCANLASRLRCRIAPASRHCSKRISVVLRCPSRPRSRCCIALVVFNYRSLRRFLRNVAALRSQRLVWLTRLSIGRLLVGACPGPIAPELETSQLNL